jgi:hypothetical protein
VRVTHALQLVLWASVAEWSAEQYRFRSPNTRARAPASMHLSGADHGRHAADRASAIA